MATKDDILGITPPAIDGSLEGTPKPPVTSTAKVSTPLQENTPPVGASTPAKTVEPTQVPSTGAVPVQPKQEALTSAPAMVEQKQKTYDDMISMLDHEAEGYKQSTPDEQKKLEKKKKREALFSAIGDGVSALANLYYTTKGANSSYDPEAPTLTSKWKERWDKIKQDADDNRAARMNILFKKYGLYNEKEQSEQAQRQNDREYALRERAQIRLDADAETRRNIGDARAELYKAQQNKDAAMSAFYEAKTNALESGASLDEALKVAKIAKEKAITAKINRTGGSGSGSTGGGEFRAYDSKGGVHFFKTEKAARWYAQQQGTWQAHASATTVTTKGGKKATTTRLTGGTSVKPKSKPLNNYTNTKKLGL